MKLLMLAGPGASGKTKMLEATEKMALEMGLTVAIHKSSTRRTYERFGLLNERSALENPEFNKKFQDTVMADNTEDLVMKIEDEARELMPVDLFITDRSPYDYAGYFCQVFSSDLTIELIKHKRSQADDAMLAVLPHITGFTLVNLPWPARWSDDTESSDGWRADKTGKNFLWSCVVEAELNHARRRMEVNKYFEDKKFHIGPLGRVAEAGTPEQRARWALTELFPSRFV